MNTILETFYNDLIKLKLNQFPCGTGSWREEGDPGYLGKSNVNQETMLALEELAHSDVFNVKCEWSEDIPSLRQLAVHKPDIISESFIFQHFKSLRLINKNINEVDKGLLKFTQLQELSLTGNCLSSIRGAYLPPSLTVLQLFANKFSDLRDLAVDPPPRLQHLGVGYNNLTDITSYISPAIWPNLLSLDLSHNRLGNVRDTLDCLSDLKTLRNLSLMSNPITLAPGYNGYALDIMPQLQILDDISISEDDRLCFSNISEEPLNWNEAIFSVVFPSLANLRSPPANEPIDEPSCYYPVQKKCSYLVRFSFISNSSPGENAPVEDAPGEDAPGEEEEYRALSCESKVGVSPDALAAVNSGVSQELALIGLQSQAELPAKEAFDGSRNIFTTTELEWKDGDLEFEQPVFVKCSDLPSLEQFLQQERLQFTVVEKVVESFTIIAPPEPATPTPPPSGKGGKKGGKEKEVKKDKKGGDKDILRDKDGNALKWVESAPSYNEIAYITADISALSSKTVSCMGSVECTVTEKPPPTPLDDGRTSVCSAKGGKGGKGGAKGKKGKVPTPVPCTPPQPLKLDYKLERIVWNDITQCKTWVT